MAILRFTNWIEDGPAQLLRPRVVENQNGGGWSSCDEMKRKRFEDFKKYSRKIEVTELENGFRTDEPLSGVLAGATRVEVIEFIG